MASAVLAELQSALSFAGVPQDLPASASRARAELGDEFVLRFAVFAARKLVSVPSASEGTLEWLTAVHARVQFVAPTLMYLEDVLKAPCFQLLLEKLRFELLTEPAKQGLARAAFESFASSKASLALASKLVDLGWTPELEPFLIDALCNGIREHVKQTCAGIFDLELLESMLHWMNQNAFVWLGDFVPAKSVAVARDRVEFFVHETFGSLRISELFDIVTMFPDSMPALVDLKTCMVHTHQHRELVASFGEALERRLLHPGANTNSILIVYVRTIKALRLLDPLGVLLESVQERVRVYLRSRPETVRCVVTALTNDGSNSDLFAELGLDSTDVRPLEFDNEEALDEADDAQSDWEPDPIDADPSSTSKSRSTNDILSMLVRIYGSVQVFVNEYRTLLADRLLKTSDFDVDAELRSLELLKLRFGEAAMHGCALMIKDVSDSRRLKAIMPRQEGDFPFEAVVVSRVSWPGLSGETFEVHPTVRQAAQAYSKKFSELKKLRRIRWCHHVGVMELRVSVPNCEPRVYSVAPVLGNLLMHLVDRPEWSLAQLAQACGLDEEVTKKKMAFWVAEGVALETKRGGYEAAKVLEKTASETGGLEYNDEDMQLEEDDNDDDNPGSMDRSMGGSAGNEWTGKDNAHSLFVVHMLTNLGKLGADAIHRNFMLFSHALGEHAYDRSPDELHAFLHVMISRGLVEMNIETGEFQVPTA